MPFALLPLLLNLAPTVASWILGDKTGNAVQKVTDIASHVLGTTDPDAVEHAISTDPNLALQFKMAVIQAEAQTRRDEIEAEKSAAQAQIDEMKAQLADIASARAQTVSLAQLHSPMAYGAAVISAIVMAGFISMLYLVLTKEVPEGSRDLANIMLGTLGTLAVSVVTFWVGSSRGSSQKDMLVTQMALNTAKPPPSS